MSPGTDQERWDQRWRWLWPTLVAGVLLVHVIWLALDQAPAVWDMAHHQLRGLEAGETWLREGLIDGLAAISDYYPPLYYLQEAFFFALFGNTSFIALLSNLSGILLLAWCTRSIAAHWVSPPLAAIAGVLPLLLPMAAWTSRLSLIDISLSGWVALTVLLLLRSECATRSGWSIPLGLAAAAGMLTKWTFPAFVAPAAIYAWAVSGNRKKALAGLTNAALAAAPFVMWWYLPNAQALMERFRTTSQAAVLENDPTAWELAGWIYYPRILSSYYLFLPLTALTVWGIARKAFKSRAERPDGEPPFGLILIWLTGGMALITLLSAKDPRYAMPLVSPLAVLLVWLWRDRPRTAAAAAVLAGLQFLSISFPLPGGPIKLALFEWDPPGDYRTLSREWVLYQSQYFDIAGPPRSGDWRYGELLEGLPRGARIGFVPEHPYFSTSTLGLEARLRGRRLQVERLEEGSAAGRLDRLSHVVGKSGDQGIALLTEGADAVYRRLQEAGWRISLRLELPDGSQAIVYERPVESPSSNG